MFGKHDFYIWDPRQGKDAESRDGVWRPIPGAEDGLVICASPGPVQCREYEFLAGLLDVIPTRKCYTFVEHLARRKRYREKVEECLGQKSRVDADYLGIFERGPGVVSTLIRCYRLHGVFEFWYFGCLEPSSEQRLVEQMRNSAGEDYFLTSIDVRICELIVVCNLDLREFLVFCIRPEYFDSVLKYVMGYPFVEYPVFLRDRDTGLVYTVYPGRTHFHDINRDYVQRGEFVAWDLDGYAVAFQLEGEEVRARRVSDLPDKQAATEAMLLYAAQAWPGNPVKVSTLPDEPGELWHNVIERHMRRMGFWRKLWLGRRTPG